MDRGTVQYVYCKMILAAPHDDLGVHTMAAWAWDLSVETARLDQHATTRDCKSPRAVSINKVAAMMIGWLLGCHRRALEGHRALKGFEGRVACRTNHKHDYSGIKPVQLCRLTTPHVAIKVYMRLPRTKAKWKCEGSTSMI